MTGKKLKAIHGHSTSETLPLWAGNFPVALLNRFRAHHTLDSPAFGDKQSRFAHETAQKNMQETR